MKKTYNLSEEIVKAIDYYKDNYGMTQKFILEKLVEEVLLNDKELFKKVYKLDINGYEQIKNNIGV